MKSYQDKLKESWEILSNNKGIRETWPDEKELTLLDFADQCKDETLRNNKEELEQCHRTGKLYLVPTLAICGGIEAGKSSIIASFLTDENQERVLRGGGKENGTVFISQATFKKNIESQTFVKHATLTYNNNPIYIYHEDL